MSEKLLQFIWNCLYFDKRDLKTVDGNPLIIFQTGIWNTNQGPDFLSARVQIANQVWAGNIEIHIKTSEWDLHGHSHDRNYDNVVLHVVWEHDADCSGNIPVFELKGRVPIHLLHKYTNWMTHQGMIPCSGEIGKADKKISYAFLQRLSLQRMKARSGLFTEKVRCLGMDWEEGFWRALARAFGHKVNADAFEAIASTLPVKLMLRLRHNPFQLEALLLGQGGLLRTDNGDDYAKNLFSEYGYLRKKYHLAKSYHPVHFLRMRPGNFPTIRLSQLATLINKKEHLFSSVMALKDIGAMKAFLKVDASAYWDEHYRFGEKSVFLKKQTGDQFGEMVIYNTIIPMGAAYHQHAGNEDEANRLYRLLEHLKPESNTVINAFSRLDLIPRHAADSQALLELKKDYCDQLRCLDCPIGKSLLKNTSLNNPVLH